MPNKSSRSPDDSNEWVLPASIPIRNLKGRDLEECAYWLLDSMGAKDLQWRTGGAGGGAADGGRDLEAKFYTPTADGEIEAHTWWVECKGRTRTVEPEEVKAAVNNALAIDGLDYIVIATNTQFSNPTHDWVKAWQKKHPKPKVKMWDHTQLERYLSRHPGVVLRLFSEALSLEGRLKAMESRFWNQLEFVTPKTLADLWEGRKRLGFTPMELFAAIANEFANGEISRRPWGTILKQGRILDVLRAGLGNVIYLVVRSETVGVDQEILFRTFAYLLLAALDVLPAETVTGVISDSIKSVGGGIPEKAQEVLLTPIINQLFSEMQDVCSSDCKRVLNDRTDLLRNTEIDDYWWRLEPGGMTTVPDSRRYYLIIEKQDEPCVVGFPVDEKSGCPLFHVKPTLKNVGDLLGIIKRVANFRKVQAAQEGEAAFQHKKKPVERPQRKVTRPKHAH